MTWVRRVLAKGGRMTTTIDEVLAALDGLVERAAREGDRIG